MVLLLHSQSLFGDLDSLQVTAAFVILALVVLFLHSAIKYRYFHPLSKFPGPFWASITPLYAMWAFMTGKEHIVIENLHRKYGPIIRYQPEVLIFADPKMIPIIYNRQANKTEYNNTIFPGEATSVINYLNYQEHAAARRRIAGPYSMSSAREMESTIDARILEWIDLTNRRYAQTDTKLEFASWVQFFTYDVISEIAFSRPFGFMETDSDVHTLIKSFHDVLHNIILLAKSDLVKKTVRHPLVAKYFMPNLDYKVGIGRMRKERDSLVDERVKSGGSVKKADLLQFFLDAKNADGSPITIREVKAELLLVMFAGSDTTAATLRGILMNVLQTSGCYEKLVAEIDDFTKSNPECSVISYNDAQNLKYLTACIKESMRYSPSTPTIIPRAPPMGGMTLEDGRYIPEATKLSVVSHVTQRNKEIYGEDAEEYNPERWLESEAKVRRMEKYDFHFGGGARVCLGKNIAYLELWKGAFEFFRHYQPTFVAPEEIKIRNIGILVHQDLWIDIKKRGEGLK